MEGTAAKNVITKFRRKYGWTDAATLRLLQNFFNTGGVAPDCKERLDLFFTEHGEDKLACDDLR